MKEFFDDNTILIVLIVVLIIWFGIFYYLNRIETKINELRDIVQQSKKS